MLTQKEINEMRGLTTYKKRGCGNGLVIIRDPRAKKGGLYFSGVMGRKVNGRRVQRDCWIGTEGKGVGQLTQKQAMEKWLLIKQWSIDNDRNPADYAKRGEEELEKEKTLRDAIERFLAKKKTKIKEVTHREYSLKLNNNVLAFISPDTPLRELEWKNGGREKVMNVLGKIEDGEKYDLANRCQGLLSGVFDCAISAGWMYKDGDGRNPAAKMKGDDSPKSSNHHHHCISWNEVPALLDDIEMNRSSTNIQAVLATKLLLMTVMRAGAICRLQWEWFDTDFENTITIPGSTPGLKRVRGKNDHIPHHIPITTQMHSLFNFLRRFNGDGEYVFTPIMQSRFHHLDPSAPNNFLRSIGYKDVLRMHGWRRTANTAGIDVLKVELDVIKRQLGHLPEGKVNQAYDGSHRMDERREYLQSWCDLLEENGMRV